MEEVSRSLHRRRHRLLSRRMGLLGVGWPWLEQVIVVPEAEDPRNCHLLFQKEAKRLRVSRSENGVSTGGCPAHRSCGQMHVSHTQNQKYWRRVCFILGRKR